MKKISGVQSRLEKIRERLAGEMDRRTETAEKLGALSATEIESMMRVCRDQLVAIAMADVGSGEQELKIITKMPFEEAGAKL